MTTITEDRICICMDDSSPDERREYLMKAIASAMRWYALNPDKRIEDINHASVLSDLLQELVEIDNASQQ